MYCKNCGKKMPDTAKFCTACGAPAGGGQSTKAMRTPAGADKDKRKNLGWIIRIGAAALVLVTIAAGLFILGMPKKTGFVVRVVPDVEYGGHYEIRYYYKDGKLVTGWFEVDDKRYYSAEESGARCNTDGFNSFDWYEYGRLYANGAYVIDGMRYSFDDKGECTGQTKVLKTKEYYGENGLKQMFSYNDSGSLAEEWSSHDMYSFRFSGDVGSYGTRIYSYDADGNLTKVEGYGEDGSLWGYCIYSYDANGNKVKEERYENDKLNFHEYRYYDRSGNLTKCETGWYSADTDEIRYYDYDGKGNVTKVEKRDSEGRLSYYEEVSYDRKGNLIMIEGMWDAVRCYVECSYDDKGNLAKKEVYDENGNLSGCEEYDDKGNLTKDVQYDENGNLSGYAYYSYDGKGNLTKREWYDENGNPGAYRSLSYDGKGNLTKDEWYDENGNLKKYIYYSYDDKGNQTEEERWEQDGKKRSYEYNCIYDGKDNLIRTEEYDDGILRSAKNYDSDGDILKEERYSSDGMLSEYTIYSYY